MWINLPDLPWHYYEWDAISRKPIGTPLVMDKSTISKTRPATTKIRIEIDLTRPLINKFLVEIRNDEGTAGVFIQKAEYETIPAFCFHRMIQRHREDECRKLHPELRNSQWKNDKNSKQGQQHNTMPNDLQKKQVTNQEKAGNMKKTDPIPDCNIQNTNRVVVISEQKSQSDDWQTVGKRKGNHKKNFTSPRTNLHKNGVETPDEAVQFFKTNNGQSTVVITHNISNEESKMEKFPTITDTDLQREISEAPLLLDVPEHKMHFQHSPVCLFWSSGKTQNFPKLFIQEPMVNERKIDKFKRFLVFQHCAHNIFNKIWIFWSTTWISWRTGNN